VDALFTICEGVDGIDGTPEMSDGIATIRAVVINFLVQPDQQNILDHLNIDSLSWHCVFWMSRWLFCF
jgi:hypothetical protein